MNLVTSQFELVSGSPRSRRDVQRDASRRCKLRRYGLTVRQYEHLLQKQGGACALCGLPSAKKQARVKGGPVIPERLHVDHDHRTGKVRGLLCWVCNTGIGKLRDDPGLLRKAAEYIERGGFDS